MTPASLPGLFPAAQGSTPAEGAAPGRESLLSLLEEAGALPAEAFATLLGEHLAEASPQALQEMLGEAGGRPLPEDGKDLPLEALLALLTGAAGAPATPAAAGAQGAADGGAAQALPTLVRELTARLPGGDAGPQAASAPGADPAEAAPPPLSGAGRIDGPLPAASPAAPAPVEGPVGHPGWDRAVGQRVLWLVDQRGQTAQLRLNPPELGPVEVRLRMDGEQVHLSFSAGHVQVREALEQALPRLREMFAEAGLSLGNVDVSQQGPGGRADGSKAPAAAAVAGGAEGPELEADGGAPRLPLRGGAGLVDTFA